MLHLENFVGMEIEYAICGIFTKLLTSAIIDIQIK